MVMKIRRILCSVCLLLVIGLMLISPTAALAADEKLELSTSYSKLEGTSSTSFQFMVQLIYTAATPATFNLSVSGPQNWYVYITPDYPKDQKIRDIRIDPMSSLDNLIDINAAPYSSVSVPPGEYKITLEVSSGSIKETIDLYAVVTANYEMALTTPDGLLNTSATAGRDNFFTIQVQNPGTASIDNITFSSDQPTDWAVTFNPERIASLNAGSAQTVTVNIKPEAKAISGDYGITLTAEGKQASQSMALRVTVNTPTIWGFVGVGIIVLVFAGLAFVFIRFSRR
jgi:uncharacterized membrane protein